MPTGKHLHTYLSTCVWNRVCMHLHRYMYVVRYKKTFRYTKKVWAHDEASEARLGDVVRLQPLGYRIGPWKNYLLVRILHKEPRPDSPQLPQ